MLNAVQKPPILPPKIIAFTMKRITVFCGSSLGTDELYRHTAFRLGQMLAERGIGLVYGGAKVGLMGAVADGALSRNGEVIGVIPTFLRGKELRHDGLSELILTASMHERKARMDELSEGVIALPGGFGTLDELFEMLTWGQLGLHGKPIGLLDVAGYYAPLMQMVQNMTDAGFLKPENQAMLLVDSDMEGLLTQMQNYQAPEVPKWITREEV